MNIRIGIALIIVTFVSLGLAIHSHLLLRTARAIMEEELSGISDRGSLPPATPVTAPVMAAGSDDAARILELRRQMAELQAERDKLRASLVAAESALAGRSNEPAVVALPASATNSLNRVGFEERMAQIKRDDPARYEEMQKQREDFRQYIQAQADERAEFLKKVDTASMTDAQRANHEALLQTVAQARALMAGLATMSPEDAAAARQQMSELIGTVGTLYQQERRYLLEQTGRAMGYVGAESGQFADYIQQIYEQTTMPRGLGGRGFGNRDRGNGATGTPGVGAPAPAK